MKAYFWFTLINLSQLQIRHRFGLYDEIAYTNGKKVRHCNWIRFLRVSESFGPQVSLHIKKSTIGVKFQLFAGELGVHKSERRANLWSSKTDTDASRVGSLLFAGTAGGIVLCPDEKHLIQTDNGLYTWRYTFEMYKCFSIRVSGGSHTLYPYLIK